MRKVIQLTRAQLDTLDAIVAEIVLFNRQQAMGITSNVFIEEREMDEAEQAEKEELQKGGDREEARDREHAN